MNNMKTFFLLVLLTVTLVIVGELVGETQGMMFFFILALMFNAGCCWFSDKIVLRMYRAKPAPGNSRLTKTVRRVSQMTGLPMPKVFIIDKPHANAFATGRNPDHAVLAATTGLLVMITAPIAAVLIQMAISQSREFAADQTGAGYVHSPNGLASALQKLHISSKKIRLNANPATAHMFIVNPLSARRMTKLFSTHPPLEERIARLKAIT